MKIIFLLLLVVTASCSTDNKEDSGWQLPEATEVGANTFGTYINGNPFFPRSGTGLHGVPDYGMTWRGGYPDVTDYNEIKIVDYRSEHSSSMLIHIQALDSLGVGTYVVDESNGMSDIDGYLHNYIHCKIWNSATNSFSYYRSFSNSGTIEISRYDRENGICSGTFSCMVRNSQDPNDEILISEGRFDINGYTLPQVIFP